MDAGCGNTFTMRSPRRMPGLRIRRLHTNAAATLAFLTAFNRTDTFVLGKELVVKTEVSIEYCVV
jgi:hypothetical protein